MPSSPASEGDTTQAPEERADREREADAVAELRERNSELEDRYSQLEDRYHRALADLDNLRKRTGREVDRRVAELREALVRDWLEAIDSVERALRMEHDGPLFEGLHAVLEQMEEILRRQGVKRIGGAGEPFDPERHEAVGVVASDELPDRTVVEVARSGFAIGDRVVRPAQVVVARSAQREE
jgi:molecular chaperone GrpE